MSKAQEIADEVVAKYDADIAYPKRMHMSELSRWERYYFKYADEADARRDATLVDVYAAATLLLEKYEPDYRLLQVRKQHTFT